ncbi:hypothetical protein NITHO_5680004 [Nitrolancea hollandica Lb]|uniref:Uncharacterized protein n=1 Tax=Nitrolancea hollandica Lb TaxID=1129897 RepID=I4EM63_9BACT|nr:hypothetical protein NITHO_5680004 [Nitrolancea hollandica Lb]
MNPDRGRRGPVPTHLSRPVAAVSAGTILSGFPYPQAKVEYHSPPGLTRFDGPAETCGF